MESSPWVVDLTGDGARAAVEVATTFPAPYCSCTGFCAEHLHFMAVDTPAGPVVISFPREATEGADLTEHQLTPVYTAAVYHAKVRPPSARPASSPTQTRPFAREGDRHHGRLTHGGSSCAHPAGSGAPAQGRSIVRLPTFAGRKRPTVKMVLPAILEAVAVLPEHIGTPWMTLSMSSFVQVDDQRECANLASLMRNYMVRVLAIMRLHRNLGAAGAHLFRRRATGDRSDRVASCRIKVSAAWPSTAATRRSVRPKKNTPQQPAFVAAAPPHSG